MKILNLTDHVVLVLECHTNDEWNPVFCGIKFNISRTKRCSFIFDFDVVLWNHGFGVELTRYYYKVR